MVHNPVQHNHKTVGEIRFAPDNAKLYVKRVRKSKHLFRLYNAWGISDDVLMSLPRQGVKRVVVLESEEGLRYEIELETFIAASVPIQFDGDRQHVLPLEYWRTTGGVL